MKNSNLIPLTTEYIVSSIQTLYINLSEKLLRENPLLFGIIDKTPTVLIQFQLSVPSNENQFHNEKISFFLVNNFTQVIDVLKELNIYRDSSEMEILKKYTENNFDKNNPKYLAITCFKPLSFN